MEPAVIVSITFGSIQLLVLVVIAAIGYGKLRQRVDDRPDGSHGYILPDCQKTFDNIYKQSAGQTADIARVEGKIDTVIQLLKRQG